MIEIDRALPSISELVIVSHRLFSVPPLILAI